MKKINLLQLISGLGQGGAEQLIFDLSKEYKKNNNINNYIVSISDDITMLSQFKNNDLNIKVLFHKKTIKDFIYTIKELILFIKQNNISIIHAHMFHSLVIASLLKIKFPNIKIVFTPHNYNIGSILRECIVWLLKPYRDVDVLFADDMKRWFHKNRYEIIPNGIKTDEFTIQSKKNDIFTFIAVGNIKKAKNYLYLIHCINNLKNKFNFQLYIIGDGKDKALLESEIKKLSLEKYVFLKGFQENVATLLSQAHCLVMPSLWEGMPLVILEAAASNIPVIVTPVGAIPSIVNQHNGYIVELKDFCVTMQYVYDNYNESIAKSNILHSIVLEHYSIEKISAKYQSLYIRMCV